MLEKHLFKNNFFSLKTQSLQFKFLVTVISAMLAITIFIGGLSIYEVDQYVQEQTEKLVNVTCENEIAQINTTFSNMEKSVKIMESYVLDFFSNVDDVKNAEIQSDAIKYSEGMFTEVVKHTSDVVAYYLRFAPEFSDEKTGFFYSKVNGKDVFVCFEPTDLSLYDKDDTEHVGWFWQPYEAGEPIWMKPYHNKNNNILMISYVIPMYVDNVFVGVVGMDFDYKVLSERVHEIKIYENGFAHLEVDGVVIHDGSESEKTEEELWKYLTVSGRLANGMDLVLFASYDDIRQIRYDIALKILFVVLFLSAFFSIIVIIVVRRIVKPLENLTEASIQLSNGNYDVKINHSSTYEINLLSTAFENMTMHLREHEKLQHLLAYRDSLTGLRNTTSYKAWVSDFNREIKEKKVEFGVIVLDVNYLKETNDKYGHDVGNKLIVTSAQIISDTFKRSPVFRIGGDEFLVILQNRDLNEYEELLMNFEEECARRSVETEKEHIPVSVAKGFAKFDYDKDKEFVDVFNRADDAMYDNKRKTKAASK